MDSVALQCKILAENTDHFLCTQGEGCGLMGAATKYCRIVHSMSQVMSVPLTVKMRTGIMENKNTAHVLIPRLRQAGAALCTVSVRGHPWYSGNAPDC